MIENLRANSRLLKKWEPRQLSYYARPEPTVTAFTVEPADELPNESEEFEDLMKKAKQTFDNIELKLKADIEDAIESAHRKGVAYEKAYTCEQHVYDFWTWPFIGVYISRCMECHEEAAKSRNIKMAKSCCLGEYATLEKQAKSDRLNALKCLSKFIREVKASARGVPERPLRTN